MLKVIDKVNGYEIQKVFHNKTGLMLRYQVVPEGKAGNTSEVHCYSSLKAARLHALSGTAVKAA